MPDHTWLMTQRHNFFLSTGNKAEKAKHSQKKNQKCTHFHMAGNLQVPEKSPKDVSEQSIKARNFELTQNAECQELPKRAPEKNSGSASWVVWFVEVRWTWLTAFGLTKFNYSGWNLIILQPECDLLCDLKSPFGLQLCVHKRQKAATPYKVVLSLKPQQALQRSKERLFLWSILQRTATEKTCLNIKWMSTLSTGE